MVQVSALSRTLRAVPIGAVLNSRTNTLHKRAAVPRQARIQGAETFVSLNSRLEGLLGPASEAINRKKKFQGMGCRAERG